MKISEITKCLEEFAPLSYQESYDNSGLIIGNSDIDVSKVLLSLDCTEEIVDEAIKANANLIISHHPLIFTGIKKLTGKSNSERAIIKAIRNNIAIYAFHTNLDNVEKGVNHKICEKLGLKNPKILSSQKKLLRKLVTFCPSEKIEDVRKAIFEAGAGVIGNYDECSYNIEGTGTFRAGEGTNPFVGKKGKRHYEKEIRIEVIYPIYKEGKILNALIKSHPYEEVAYDIYPLENEFKSVGSGMLAELEVSQNETVFLKKIKSVMKCEVIKHTKLLNRKIKKVAVCGGSGSFLLNEAIRANAHIFITSDFKYHQFFGAESKIVIADIGHHESEEFTKELIFEIINKKFPKFAILFSKVNTNPVIYF
ncbi:MAG: Nif3-like dinuclear metal center hexameric protein [Bacteroidales bacterium]